ncbi:MAG: BLUF domain-containing protein [Gammaproteobacteria bacterium]|nr:BLUF domain-containing protein [Gammaproteobacteria bacterium]
MMIRTVLYISEIASQDNKTICEHVSEIADTSKTNNRKKGITGVLAHDNEHFLHILEGESPILEGLLTKIESDQRNKNLQVMFDVIWAERIFQEWKVFDKTSVEHSQRFDQFLKLNMDSLALLDDAQFEVISRFAENVFH